MKLSDAIRLGSMASGQADGFFYLDGNTCAQGAALLAIGRLHAERGASVPNFTALRDAWPWAHTLRGDCPVCGEPRAYVAALIPHLNNSSWSGHGWTREQIADWIATIEPQDAETQTVEQAQPVAKQSERLLGTCI